MKPRKTALSLLCAVALTLTLLVVPVMYDIFCRKDLKPIDIEEA